jgi:O-antigen ligase
MGKRSRTSRIHSVRSSSVGAASDPVRLVAVILGVAVAVTPLALITGIFISHDVIPKLFMLTAAAAFLLFLYRRWSAFLEALWGLSRGRMFLILVVAQIASLVLSTLFSGQIPLSVAGTVWRRFGLIGQTAALVVAVGVACMAASRPAWVTILYRAISVCGGLASIYGIFQYFGVDPFLDRKLYSIEYFGGVTRPPSTMGHALYFSAYLVPVLFIAVSAALTETSGMWRRWCALVAVLAGTAIILSATRSAIVAAVAGGILFGWRALRRPAMTFRLKYAAVVFSAVVALSAFILSPLGHNLRNRMQQWRDDPGGPRLRMWKECPALIALHPVLGEGPDTFAGEFRRVQSLQLSRAYPDFYNETPHNALLDAACAQGIPGVVILAGIFLLTWRSGRAGHSTGLDAAMLGILISSMFASLTLVTSLYLWTIAGLAVALNPGQALPDTSPKRRVPRIACFALGAAYLAAGLVLTLQDAAWADMNSAVDARNFAAARDAYSRAISVAPGLPGYELWASREWAVLARSLSESREATEAWKFAGNAAALAEADGEERFSAAYQSSVLAIAASDITRAESEARSAIRLAPNWYKGHLLLSQILQFSGRTADADREAALSASMGWRKP